MYTTGHHSRCGPISLRGIMVQKPENTILNSDGEKPGPTYLVQNASIFS